VNNPNLIALVNHLWQSTLFALAMGSLTLLFRKNSARIRYLLWLAASAKFLVPFALLTAVGARFPWSFRPGHTIEPSFFSIAGQVVGPITPSASGGVPAMAEVTHAASYDGIILIAVGVLWGVGTLAGAAHWFRRWLVVRRALGESTQTSRAFVIPVRSSSSQLEPAVVGVLYPVLLLPESMEHYLAPDEMDAVLAHERGHVAWRDNLAATVHMLVETLFWFHPLVWWLGRHIVDERERACDEQVLAEGHTPRRYAEGILKVCDCYLQSPLSSAAGVSGANLTQRIASIMKNRMIERLGVVRKLVLALAAGATIAIPLAFGMLTSAPAGAEVASGDASASLRNVSIRVAPPRLPPYLQPPGLYNQLGRLSPDGRRVQGDYSLRGVIAVAYGVDASQVVGKDLSKEPIYEITADNPWPESPSDSGEVRGAPHIRSGIELPALLRDLLTTHFGLVIKHERRQMDGYVLAVDSNGSKLKPYGSGPSWKKAAWMSPEDGIAATDYPVSTLVSYLESIIKAPVVDDTGLQGTYEYKVAWKPGGPPDPATMAKAVEEQLGLLLEAKPVTIDVINVVSLKSAKEVTASDKTVSTPPAGLPTDTALSPPSSNPVRGFATSYASVQAGDSDWSSFAGKEIQAAKLELKIPLRPDPPWKFEADSATRSFDGTTVFGGHVRITASVPIVRRTTSGQVITVDWRTLIIEAEKAVITEQPGGSSKLLEIENGSLRVT
jgi:uncharacterized protein (TIGR03435 family)